MSRKPVVDFIIPNNKIEAIEKLEKFYYKLITNNKLPQQVTIVTPSGNKLIFNIPIEVHAFIQGLSINFDEV